MSKLDKNVREILKGKIIALKQAPTNGSDGRLPR